MRESAKHPAPTMTTTPAKPLAARYATALPRWSALPMMALMAGPAAAQMGNAVVIDFDHGRLILGWLGLWLVAALTFALCADKRTRPMTRLADYLRRRARQRADDRSDAALRAMAQDDPRILGELQAAVDVARARLEEASQAQVAPVMAEPSAQSGPKAKPATAGRTRRTPGFRTAPLPGMPHHLQYLPG